MCKGIRLTPSFPIVLCHGLLGFDRLGPFDYFMKIKTALSFAGANVHVTTVPPISSIAARAARLKEQLQVITQQHKTKVHVIAHSMGGLDARYLVSHLDGSSYVRSITTLATPHHGSPVADWGMVNIGVKFRVVDLLTYLRVPHDAFMQLTTKYCTEEFNPATPNHPGVSYFSYGAAKTHVSYVNPLHYFHNIIQQAEGENDGLVSVKSSKWGEYLGTIACDHMEIINWSPFFDAKNIYLEVAKFLIDHEDEIEIQRQERKQENLTQDQQPSITSTTSVITPKP